jgi:hypothetical protein
MPRLDFLEFLFDFLMGNFLSLRFLSLADSHLC